VGKLRAITLTAFQETLHRRVFYIVLLVAVLIVASIASQMILIRMATEAGEADLVSNGARSLVTGTLSTWTAAVMFLALFVGAIGISSEINAKTIVHVLSRPVDRWVYLFGRWFGTLMFLWMFLSLGIAVALLIALGYGVPHTPALWLGLGELFVSSSLFSGVALAMSVVMPPVLRARARFC